MSGRFLKGLQLGLLITGYPVIFYLLISHHLAWMGTLIVISVAVWRLRQRDKWLWWTAAVLAGVLVAAHLFGGDTILKLSPLFIHSSLLYLFASSLGDIPLIERFARLDFGDTLPPGVAAYCRKLTILWAVFFAANIAGCTWLAIRGDASVWALYNGFIVYLLIGGLLLGEYLWRRLAFPDMEIPSPMHSIRSIVNTRHKIWEQAKQ